MNAKRYFVALLSALALMPAWTKLAAEPLIFFFSGDITSRRATNSVFTEPNTDQFYGYFSYDTAARSLAPGEYPVISFSIDGNDLAVPPTNSPFPLPYASIMVLNRIPSAGGDTLYIQGFYPQAGGRITIQFTDSSGLLFTNNNLPTRLDLASFDKAYLQGPLLYPPPGPTYDLGPITQLIQIPEPVAWGLLGLGLLAAGSRRRR